MHTTYNIKSSRIVYNTRQVVQNRPKRIIKNRRAIDLPRLMADPHLRTNLQNAIAAKLACPTPGTNAGSVDDIASLLTETLLSNAADISPPIRRKQVPGGWCATEATKAEFNSRWLDRENATKRVRFAPNSRGLRQALRATTNSRFFEDYVDQLEGRIREGD